MKTRFHLFTEFLFENRRLPGLMLYSKQQKTLGLCYNAQNHLASQISTRSSYHATLFRCDFPLNKNSFSVKSVGSRKAINFKS